MKVGNMAEWAAAVFTTGTLVLALWQIRKNQVETRNVARRLQASKVTAWLASYADQFHYWAAVNNASKEPVYWVILSVAGAQGIYAPYTSKGKKDYPHRVLISVVPPGRHYVWISSPGHGMGSRLALEMTFSDANNVNWARNWRGVLEQIDESPLVYFGLSGPLMQGWLESTDLRDDIPEPETPGGET